jgi:hypothetical protein
MRRLKGAKRKTRGSVAIAPGIGSRIGAEAGRQTKPPSTVVSDADRRFGQPHYGHDESDETGDPLRDVHGEFPDCRDE